MRRRRAGLLPDESRPKSTHMGGEVEFTRPT